MVDMAPPSLLHSSEHFHRPLSRKCGNSMELCKAEGDAACPRALKDIQVVCLKGLQLSCAPTITDTPYPSLPDWIDGGGEG